MVVPQIDAMSIEMAILEVANTQSPVCFLNIFFCVS